MTFQSGCAAAARLALLKLCSGRRKAGYAISAAAIGGTARQRLPPSTSVSMCLSASQPRPSRSGGLIRPAAESPSSACSASALAGQIVSPTESQQPLSAMFVSVRHRAGSPLSRSGVPQTAVRCSCHAAIELSSRSSTPAQLCGVAAISRFCSHGTARQMSASSSCERESEPVRAFLRFAQSLAACCCALSEVGWRILPSAVPITLYDLVSICR
mmetsp:Transcript_63611/g.174665  ORF Transcript_63611/g.174665 Transcript_63611/m.174665 type:complete len:214 (+) Transcript_63611:112-753(+)